MASIDISRIRALDIETPRFHPGYMAPDIVCSSSAAIVDGKPSGELLVGEDATRRRFEEYFLARYMISFANGAYDLAVIANRFPELFPLIFRAIESGEVYDVLIGESLNAIYHGHLGEMPSGGPLVNPSTGKETKRYSLALSVYLTLGRLDAKKNDVWRESYALLQGIPVQKWPPEASQYPIDDANNTVEDTAAQLFGRPGRHEWRVVPRIPGDTSFLDHHICAHCGVPRGDDFAQDDEPCAKAPLRAPHKNVENMPQQVAAAVALHLGACHSLRTDPEKVEKLAAEVEAKHVKAVERFQKKGWIRDDGTEDQASVKRAIAHAYGATGKCKRCDGGFRCPKCAATGNDGTGFCRSCEGLGIHIGKIQKIDIVECRGEKLRGRFQGCMKADCGVCFGSGQIEKPGNIVTCKNVFDEGGAMTQAGCDGTGFDLMTAPTLPLTDKLGVKTDRDTTMESGDEELSDFGENEFEKSRTAYVPYLRTGIHAPLYYSPNVLVATGRCSYENCPLHQMPRSGGERECVRSRGRWCGYPIEMILGSTDYEAGELCTLGQLTYWLFDYSQMRDAINKSGKPGILHSDLASEVLGISLEEFMVRLKAKDKQAIDFRQMCKPINFGVPGGMGIPKLVLTSRKKNAGFTECPDGPAVNTKGKPGYWGVRFCILTGGAKQCGLKKILEYRGPGARQSYPCAPVCEACVEVVENMLKPAYFRRYPEVKDYFKWVQRMIDEGRPAPTAVWDPAENAPKIIRERGCTQFSEFANNGFQSMLSDIGKDAFYNATKECYLGVKPDGSPSPLYGCRLPLYLHDEPLSELILDTSHLSAPRIAEIMMESGRRLAPDLTWKAESATAFWWSKSMESNYDAFGKLIPWGPIPDYLQPRFAAAA